MLELDLNDDSTRRSIRRKKVRMVVRHSASSASPPSAYESALRTAIADLERALVDRNEAQKTLGELELRISDLTDLVQHLRAVLPTERRAEFANQMRQLQLGTSMQSRGGPVFDNVVELLKRDERREWSASEIQDALSGYGDDPKAIYNVLGYLARKGQLKRLSRGRYLIKHLGMDVQIDQEIPGADDGRGDCED